MIITLQPLEAPPTYCLVYNASSQSKPYGLRLLTVISIKRPQTSIKKLGLGESLYPLVLQKTLDLLDMGVHIHRYVFLATLPLFQVSSRH